MLIAYTRIPQDGIEKLENYSEPVKDGTSGHYLFDDFRITLKYSYDKNNRVSGVGVLIFAPNGLIWCQRGIYCHEFNKFGSLYYAIEQILEEADKSKAKNLTIYVDDKNFAKAFKYLNPYKDEAYNTLHAYIIEKLKVYPKCQVLFRNSYPKEVKKRLLSEAESAANMPKFDNRGHWQNQTGITYFEIKEQTEEEVKMFAEQYARMYLDFIESYMEEYREEVGEENFKKFVKSVRDGKIKKLPDVKRVRDKKERYVKVKTFPTLNKAITCQNCKAGMLLENCFMKYPEHQLRFLYRCQKCRATRELNEKGRTLTYGKFPIAK